MPWESENEESGGRDWSKLMWYGVVALLCVMAVYLFIPKGGSATFSRVRVWHILIRYDGSNPGEREAAFETINDVRERIIDGANFSKLAKEYSGDPGSAARGGDLGWSAHGDLDDKFEEIIWTLPLNEITEVVETNHGLHIILVSNRELDEAEKYERELHERVMEQPAEETEP